MIRKCFGEIGTAATTLVIWFNLQLPFASSTKGSIPVWPFLVLSCGAGVYALLPYFVLWRPPPPPVEETDLQRWPLNFTESKLTAGVGHFIYIAAALCCLDRWQKHTSCSVSFLRMDLKDVLMLHAFFSRENSMCFAYHWRLSLAQKVPCDLWLHVNVALFAKWLCMSCTHDQQSDFTAHSKNEFTALWQNFKRS